MAAPSMTFARWASSKSGPTTPVEEFRIPTHGDGKPSTSGQLKLLPKEALDKESKFFVSLGCSYKDADYDRLAMNMIAFVVWSVCFPGLIFVGIYLPDHGHRRWANREAFLELHRREKLGLPLIDKNFIDPAKIKLPTEDEIGDQEIFV